MGQSAVGSRESSVTVVSLSRQSQSAVPVGSRSRRMAKLNRRWHAAHRMPARATLEQRIAWHTAHARHCGAVRCRRGFSRMPTPVRHPRRTPPVKTHGLTHVALAVRDPQRSLSFYRAVLGVVPVYEQKDFVQAQTPGSRDRARLRAQAAPGRQSWRRRALRLSTSSSSRHLAGARCDSGGRRNDPRARGVRAR